MLTGVEGEVCGFWGCVRPQDGEVHGDEKYSNVSSQTSKLRAPYMLNYDECNLLYMCPIIGGP